MVSCDVSFTSDGVAVLLHDDQIDRTSDGTGNISEMTLAQVKEFDFGSWKSAAYADEEIPTFEEFIKVFFPVIFPPLTRARLPVPRVLMETLSALKSKAG